MDPRRRAGAVLLPLTEPKPQCIAGHLDFVPPSQLSFLVQTLVQTLCSTPSTPNGTELSAPLSSVPP